MNDTEVETGLLATRVEYTNLECFVVRKQEHAKVVNELKIWGTEIWSDIIWKTASWDGSKEKENARERYDGFHGVIWWSAELRHVTNGVGIEEERTRKGGIGQFLCFEFSFLVWCYP